MKNSIQYWSKIWGFILFFLSTPIMANPSIQKGLFLHYNMAHAMQDTAYIRKLYKDYTQDISTFPPHKMDTYIGNALYVGQIPSALKLAEKNIETLDFSQILLGLQYIKQKNLDSALHILSKSPETLSKTLIYLIAKYTNNVSLMKKSHKEISDITGTLKDIDITSMEDLHNLTAEILLEAYPDTISPLQMALYMSPDNTNIKYNIILAYAQDQSPYMIGKMAIKIPKNKHTNMVMYHVYQSLDSKDTDIKDIVLSRIEPHTPYWYMTIAYDLMEKRQYRKAQKYIQDANKTLTFIDDWSYWYELGIVHERQNNIAQAQKFLNTAIELSEHNPEVVNYLAYTEIINNIDVEKNLRKLKLAYKDSPTPYIADSLGWAYYHTQNYKKAVVYLEKAVETMPNNGTINDHLGDVYFAMGRKREALIHWERALLDTQDIDLNPSLIKQKIKDM